MASSSPDIDRPRLDGLGALVTGATSGIGRAVADAFEAVGARVIRHGLTCPGGPKPDLGDDLAEAGSGRRVALAALGRGPVDIVVCAASVQIRTAWTDLTTDELNLQWRVNVVGAVEMLQELVPPMAERGRGRVLTIGSVQQRRPHPAMIGYAATKAAQLNVVLNLARQLAGSGVTVNNLAPGVIDTPRNAEPLADAGYRDEVLASIPAGRIGAPTDCVGAALLLCSAAGSYITGQDLYVDGGMAL